MQRELELSVVERQGRPFVCLRAPAALAAVFGIVSESGARYLRPHAAQTLARELRKIAAADDWIRAIADRLDTMARIAAAGGLAAFGEAQSGAALVCQCGSLAWHCAATPGGDLFALWCTECGAASRVETGRLIAGLVAVKALT